MAFSPVSNLRVG